MINWLIIQFIVNAWYRPVLILIATLWDGSLTCFQIRRLEQGEMEELVGSPTVRGLPWRSGASSFPMHGAQFWFLVRELGSHMSHGQIRQTKQRTHSQEAAGQLGWNWSVCFQLRRSCLQSYRVCVPRVYSMQHTTDEKRQETGVIMVQMCPRKSRCWSPSPQCDGAWRGAFGEELGLGEVGFLSRCQGGHSRAQAASTLNLNFPTSWIVGNKRLLFKTFFFFFFLNSSFQLT